MASLEDGPVITLHVQVKAQCLTVMASQEDGRVITLHGQGKTQS